MRCGEIQIGGNSFRKIRYLFQGNDYFLRRSLNFGEKHTFSEKGRHFREFCENDARCPWVELVDLPNNSLKFNETHTFSEQNGFTVVNSAKMTHVSHG